MCGIFGYIGKGDARKNIIDGLKRLEYRGYDSWGVAVAVDNEIGASKQVGPIGKFEDIANLPYANVGIGHTRWATHGGVTENNAHPHYSTDKRFILAQNGIVENYQELKKKLIDSGFKFETQTDTEVIVRLIEDKLKDGELSLAKAVREAFQDLRGRNTIILLEEAGEHIIAVRNGSPLVIGLGKGEVFFASDTLSFADKTSQVIYVDNNVMAEYIDGAVKLMDILTGKEIPSVVTTLDKDNIEINKDGFDHYMLKEIVEQKHTIREAIQYTKEELGPLTSAIKKAATVYTVGAGTAGFAAGQIAFYLRKYANIKAIELKSYEMVSYKGMFTQDDLLIAVSQSGETADTIEAIEYAKAKGVKIASIVNMIGSTISRISDYQYYSRSGPEICVASTKAFTAQISWGLLLALSLVNKYDVAVDLIYDLSGKFEKYFTQELFTNIKKLVDVLEKHEHFFVLGRDQNYYVALEGALKVKEITYKHFEGFAAGELKHGVIALVDKGTPVFVISSDDDAKSDMLSAAAQVKARGAFVIGVAKMNNDLYDYFIPTIEAHEADAIANVIPFQLISYFLGVKLGNDPDKPRNLAKSVTVK